MELQLLHVDVLTATALSDLLHLRPSEPSHSAQTNTRKTYGERCCGPKLSAPLKARSPWQRLVSTLHGLRKLLHERAAAPSSHAMRHNSTHPLCAGQSNETGGRDTARAAVASPSDGAGAQPRESGSPSTPCARQVRPCVQPPRVRRVTSHSPPSPPAAVCRGQLILVARDPLASKHDKAGKPTSSTASCQIRHLQDSRRHGAPSPRPGLTCPRAGAGAVCGKRCCH